MRLYLILTCLKFELNIFEKTNYKYVVSPNVKQSGSIISMFAFHLSNKETYI